MVEERPVLVTGATGRQGGAVARQLIRRGWKVRALTRNPDGRPARVLSKLGAEVVNGYFDDAASISRALEGVCGTFAVHTFRGNEGAAGEERQGKAFAAAVARAGVSHLVYSSVGGADRRTGIPHFESKWRIEEHVRALGIPATVLRPVFFMENLEFPFPARAVLFGAIASELGQDKPLQLIASEDIGVFAAMAFERRGEMIGRALEIAGDSLTVPQMTEIWHRETGKGFRYLPLPKWAVRRLPEEMSSMLEWFGREGYRADIPALRGLHPELMTFAEWVRKRHVAGE
jgi:uncharacterized protein YbjT (DUF2867 family)